MKSGSKRVRSNAGPWRETGEMVPKHPEAAFKPDISGCLRLEVRRLLGFLARYFACAADPGSLDEGSISAAAR